MKAIALPKTFPVWQVDTKFLAFCERNLEIADKIPLFVMKALANKTIQNMRLTHNQPYLYLSTPNGKELVKDGDYLLQIDGIGVLMVTYSFFDYLYCIEEIVD